MTEPVDVDSYTHYRVDGRNYGAWRVAVELRGRSSARARGFAKFWSTVVFAVTLAANIAEQGLAMRVTPRVPPT